MTGATARRWAIKAAALVPLVVSLACEAATGPPPPLPLPMTDRIVFESDRHDPLGDIYAMTFDGADLRRLTSSRVGETCPSISPDGNWIAYHVIGKATQTMLSADARKWHERGRSRYGVPFQCPIWSRDSDAIRPPSSFLVVITARQLGVRYSTSRT